MASIVVPEGPQDLNDSLALTDAGPSSDLPSGNDVQRRIFIGPMPERVIAQAVDNQPKRAKLNIGSVFSLNQDNTGRTSGDNSEEVTRVLKDNAFEFFLHHGGNAEDWREDEEQDMIDELVRKWKKSDWGQLWERRHQGQREAQNTSSNQWFGTSFEVGNLLGLDIMKSQRHLSAFTVQSTASKGTAEADNPDSDEQLGGFSTFPATQVSQIDGDIPNPGSLNGAEEPGDGGFTPTSKTNLIPSGRYAPDQPDNTSNPKPSSDRLSIPLQDNATSELDSDQRLTAEDKRKAKVHYTVEPEGGLDTIPGPAAPEEVLERTKATVDRNTSLAATIDTLKSPTPSEFSWGDVVLRGDWFLYVSKQNRY